MLKKGDLVLIYGDPLKKAKPEGEARLVSFLSAHKINQSFWLVRFLSDNSEVPRLIVEDYKSNKETLNIKYERLSSTITIEMSLLDIFAITANLHLALKHPMNDLWSSNHSKKIGRQFVKYLIDYEIGLPDEVIKEYKEVFGEE